MRLCAPRECADVQHEIGHPDDDQPQVSIPLRFGIFLGLGLAHEIARRGPGAKQIEADKHEPRADGIRQPRPRRALQHVERGGDQRIAAESENYARSMHRAQPTVACPGPKRCRLGPVHQRGQPDAHAHADYCPDQRHDNAEAGRRVIVFRVATVRWLRMVVKRTAQMKNQRNTQHEGHSSVKRHRSCLGDRCHCQPQNGQSG